MSKIINLEKIASLISSGITIAIGGFLSVGIPEKIIDYIEKTDISNLTVISNDTGFINSGVGKLIVAKKLSKVIVSHIGTNPETGKQMNNGELVVELVPQGSLAERIRCGGAGLGGVLTPVGIGTIVADNKEIIHSNGKEYILEKPLYADISLIKAKKADTLGNLIFNRSARNFNPLMATMGKVVIAEVEEIVNVGEIDPDHVIVPGIMVDYLYLSEGG